ncbi:hypothetical protein M0802_004055 [Mischocyttarus mexicanus]|nr:hypothetical protein M0802_004055 [Mischocyttarus mexicanus]
MVITKKMMMPGYIKEKKIKHDDEGEDEVKEGEQWEKKINASGALRVGGRVLRWHPRRPRRPLRHRRRRGVGVGVSIGVGVGVGGVECAWRGQGVGWVRESVEGAAAAVAVATRSRLFIVCWGWWYPAAGILSYNGTYASSPYEEGSRAHSALSGTHAVPAEVVATSSSSSSSSREQQQQQQQQEQEQEQQQQRRQRQQQRRRTFSWDQNCNFELGRFSPITAGVSGACMRRILVNRWQPLYQYV